MWSGLVLAHTTTSLALPGTLREAAAQRTTHRENLREIKYHAPTIPAITFNNGLAQMHKKPIQAMQLLESMRLSMPDVTAMQRMSQMQGGGSFTLPKGPEEREVVRTLCQVAPDAGRPPPEVVGAALKAAGLPATDENLEKALREAKGCAPSSEDMIAARMAAEHYGAQPSGFGTSSSSIPPTAGPEIIKLALRENQHRHGR
eukprot:g23805.t1